MVRIRMASIDLAWSVDPELDVLRTCVCDGMSLVKTLVKMVQGDRLQNSNRIVIAAVTGRPAAPTSQERGRSYCMHLVGCNVERAWHGGQA